MAFPTTSVLSTFTATVDEDPLSESGAWGGAIRYDSGAAGPANTLRLLAATDEVAPNDDGTNAHCSAYWNTAFGTEQEAYATVNAKPEDGSRWCQVWCRVNSPGASGIDGYCLEIDPVAGGANDVWYLLRYNDNVETVLGGAALATLEIAAGDKFGLEVTGTGATVTLRAYVYQSGAWSQVGSDYSDTSASRLTSGSYIGLGCTGTGGATRLDDFGGGDIVSGPTVIIPDYVGSLFPKPKLRGV